MDAPEFDCAICGHGEFGETRQLVMGYGVSIWVCAEHGSPGFQRLHRGRPFVGALERVWGANGCLTKARRRALDAHLRAFAAPQAARPLPGSHAWVVLRRDAERRFAEGELPRHVIAELRDMVAGHGANPPSVRTMMRWYAERRWLTTVARRDGPAGPEAPSRAAAGP